MLPLRKGVRHARDLCCHFPGVRGVASRARRADTRARSRRRRPRAGRRHADLRSQLPADRLPHGRRADGARRVQRRGDPRLPRPWRRPAARIASGHGTALRRLPEELGPRQTGPQHRSPPRAEPRRLVRAPGLRAVGQPGRRRLSARRYSDLDSGRRAATYRDRVPPAVGGWRTAAGDPQYRLGRAGRGRVVRIPDYRPFPALMGRFSASSLPPGSG